MKNNITRIILGGLLAIVLVAAGSTTVSADNNAAGRGPGGKGNGQAGAGAGSGLALTPLSEQEASDLQAAILEEYGALNFYTAVMNTYGDTYPFNVIAQSEQAHADALIRQAEKYGVAVPDRPVLPSIEGIDTLQAACAAGVEAEIADAALYDELLANTDRTDLTRVYENLQSASLEKHLPAFRTCN